MNSATTSLPLQPAGRAPAAAATRPTAWLARAASTVWNALEASGQARARRELLDFALRCEGQQPELAKELRTAAGHVSRR